MGDMGLTRRSEEVPEFGVGAVERSFRPWNRASASSETRRAPREKTAVRETPPLRRGKRDT